MYRIGIDLGGTNIVAAVTDEKLNIVESVFAPTRAYRPFEEVIADMCTLAESALALSGINKSDCSGIGVGSPGNCDSEMGIVRRAYNLGWKDVPLCELISARMGLMTTLANDADAAAYGEMKTGAAKGKKNVLFTALGTGVGVGVITDGKIYSGAGRGGVEAGHTVIMMGGEKCTCGRRGCWEAYASATALIRQAKQAAAEHPSSKLASLEEISGRTVFELADAGDAVAKEVVDKYVIYIAEGLANLINIFDPEAVVIGGGIGDRGEKLLVPIREFLADNCFGGRERIQPEILSSVNRANAGVIGAAALV